MNLKTVAFRFRAWILPILYLLGFLAPWQGLGNGRPASTLWLAASTLLARSGWIGLEDATLLVTAVALGCCCAGAVMRVWGTAHLMAGVLGAGLTSGSATHGRRLSAAGRSRHLRNLLYLGHGLLALGISILMPPSGALVFLAALFLFSLLLISAEEGLAERLVSERALAAAEIHPRWFEALLAEVFPVGFTLCFAFLAWRYNALILIKSLIVCYGLGLIARALRPSRTLA